MLADMRVTYRSCTWCRTSA